MCDYVSVKNLKFSLLTKRSPEFARHTISMLPRLLATTSTESVIPLIIDWSLLFVYGVMQKSMYKVMRQNTNKYRSTR